jgi:hypothetical protein
MLFTSVSKQQRIPLTDCGPLSAAGTRQGHRCDGRTICGICLPAVDSRRPLLVLARWAQLELRTGQMTEITSRSAMLELQAGVRR